MSMRLNKIIFLLLPLFIYGCSQDHQRAIYHPSEKDSLKFLVSNADFIGVIEIYDGIKGVGNAKSTLGTKSARAKVIDPIKGGLKRNAVIRISNESLHNKPNSIKTYLALRNGEYIGFLSNTGNTFRPLTPYSLIEIFSNSGLGRPIWKQSKSKYVDRPEIPKEKIIDEIKSAIEPPA